MTLNEKDYIVSKAYDYLTDLADEAYEPYKNSRSLWRYVSKGNLIYRYIRAIERYDKLSVNHGERLLASRLNLLCKITEEGSMPLFSPPTVVEYKNFYIYDSPLIPIDLYNLGTLTDGSSITVDCNNITQVKANVTTAQSAIAMTITNFDTLFDLSVFKTIAGDCTITFSGTGLLFVDMLNKAAESASVGITLSDSANRDFEISLKDSGRTSSGSRVILIQWI